MGWQEIRLGNLVQIKGGGTPSRKVPEYYEGDIPWATVKDLKGMYISETQEYITEDAIKDSAANLIPAGNIILCTRVGLGKVAINTIDIAINQDLKALFCCESLMPEYLLYHLNSLTTSIQHQGAGATVKGITLEQVKHWSIPLPPIAEQRRIVEILDQADSLRKKRAEANAKCDRILPALFIKMFGDPVTNSKGWDLASVKSFAKVQGGLQVTSKRKDNPLKIPYLRVANVYRDNLNLDEIKYLQVTESELKRISLEKGDILIVEGHGNRNEIGRSAIWDGSIQPCIHQNHLIRVRTDETRADPIFINAYLNSSGGREQLFRLGKTTSGLNTISTSNVKETLVMLPPIENQKTYSQQVSNFKKLSNATIRQTVQIEILFQNLLHRAFSGDLTAEWRKAHMADLLQEMEHQAKALGLEREVEYEQLGMLE